MAPQFLTLGRVNIIKLPEINLKDVEASIMSKIDELVEYPGSRKDERGGGGVWYLQDWIIHKIEKRFTGGGSERK